MSQDWNDLAQIWIPLAIYLGIVLFLGYYSTKKVRRAEGKFINEYYLGGRGLGGYMLAMTLVATYISASSFMGGPGTAYKQGLGWVLLAMTQLPTAYITLGILGKRFAIISRKVKAITVIDVIRERYDNNPIVVWVISIATVLFLIVAVVSQFVGGARLFQTVTGLPYIWGLMLFGGIVLIYVTWGGFKAVVLTDTLQGTVMLIGTILILIAAFVAGGGVSGVMEGLYNTNPDLITPFGVDDYITIPWILSFWILVCIGIIGLPQNAIRAMAYKDSRSMHRAIVIGTVVSGVLMLGLHLTGVVARVILPSIPEGFNTDHVMPLLAMDLFPAWLAGIFLAAPLATIMSTVDSQLILMSSTIMRDLYTNYINPKADAGRVKILSFLTTAILGLIIIVAAINPPSLVIWINLYAFGGLEATFFWVLILGLYWKRANAAGAIASMSVGITSFMLISKFWPRPFGTHPIILAMLLGLAAFIIGTYATSRPKDETIEKFWGV